MLNVTMQSFITVVVIILTFIMLGVITLNVIFAECRKKAHYDDLTIIMQSFVILAVIMLSCHYAAACYAGCHMVSVNILSGAPL